MDGQKAEDILNNSDLRKHSYTENLAVLNYQVSDLRQDMKGLVASQESQWKAIRDNEGMIGRLEERQSTWNKGLAVLSVVGTAIAASLGLRR